MARPNKQQQVAPPSPNPGPQAELLKCPVEDVFFGGARGGGKTYGLILDCLSRAQKYGGAANGILFRRTYLEQEQVIKVSKSILYAAGWKFGKKPPTWTSPQGATLSLRYLEAEEDAETYQGSSFDWLGFDEAGNWPTPSAIDMLMGTLRSVEGIPCVRRLTGNPGGAGHSWLKKRYIDPSEPLVPFFWVPNEEKPDYKIQSVYIPSLLEQNPLLLKNDPGYEGRLAAVGSDALYRAWRYGDWSVVSGQYFDCWRPEMACDSYLPQPWQKVWISGDWGFEDQSVIHWHCMDDAGNIVTFREVATNHKTPEELADLIVSNSHGLTPSFFFFSPDAFARRTSTHTIADEIGIVLRASGLCSVSRADNDRIGGWQLMYQLLKNGRWRITKDCPVLLESIPLLQRDAKNIEDVADSPVDNAPDSARYGLKSFIGRAKKPVSLAVSERIQNAIHDTGIQPNINDLIMIHRREMAKTQPHRPVQRRRYGSLGR